MLIPNKKEKPLARWNVGGHITSCGFDVLKESIKTTRKVLDKYDFDYVICYNNLSVSRKMEIKEYERQGIQTLEQKWETCPIPFQECLNPVKADGSIEDNTGSVGGTLWKITPPRLRINAHEIVMDNDVMILNDFKELSLFLKSNKTMFSSNMPRFYGRYDKLFWECKENYNAGFVGMPPGFDFGAVLYEIWTTNERYKKLTYADEQGLSLAALRTEEHIILYNIVIELYKEGKMLKWNPEFWEPYAVTGDEKIFHFIQSNRHEAKDHKGWQSYKTLSLNGNSSG